MHRGQDLARASAVSPGPRKKLLERELARSLGAPELDLGLVDQERRRRVGRRGRVAEVAAERRDVADLAAAEDGDALNQRGEALRDGGMGGDVGQRRARADAYALAVLDPEELPDAMLRREIRAAGGTTVGASAAGPGGRCRPR